MQSGTSGVLERNEAADKVVRIHDLFGMGKPTVSFEFFPARTPEAGARLFRTVERLKRANPSFVSVTYGAGGSTRDLTVELVGRIQAELGVLSMAHLTCVGHDVDAIDATLSRLAAAGIRNVLALRGDAPKGATEFPVAPNGFRYASQLVSFIRGRYDMCIGAAAYPEGHVEAGSPEDDINNLKHKVDSGAQFLITQLFFEASQYSRFVERTEAAGIAVPIVPGLMPVTDAAQLDRFTAMCGASIPPALRQRLAACGDDQDAVIKVGIEWATSQAEELLRMGAPGLHFYTLNQSRSAQAVCRNLALA